MPHLLDNINTNDQDVDGASTTASVQNTYGNLIPDLKETTTSITNDSCQQSKSAIDKLLATSDLLISKISEHDDEKIFKRPSSDFLVNKTTELLEASKKQIKTIARSKKDESEKSKQIKDKSIKMSYNGEKNNANGNTSKIKRSRKRTKANKSTVMDVSKLNEINSKSLFEASEKSSTVTNQKIINLTKKNLQTHFEPSIKKFASNINGSNKACSNSVVGNIDFDLNGSFERALNSLNVNFLPTLNNSNSAINTNRRDEVDLDIKELSLLDLHSSEDDSCLEFSK